MKQLALFRPPNLLLAQLHSSLAKMELQQARLCLHEYQSSWDVGLTWEPDLLRFWTEEGSPGDLDQGWSIWVKLQVTDYWPAMPLSVRLGLRTNYFQALLNTQETSATRTPNGLSRGYIYLLAGQLDSAIRLLEKETGEFMDDPVPRLHLGNARYLLGDTSGARASYRDALLAGSTQVDCREILDPEVRAFLGEVEDPAWAPVEACIRRLLPITQLCSVDSVKSFLERHSWLGNSASAATPLPVEQFYACLVLSESRRVAPEDSVMKARLHMKFLNGRLHRRYMERLETKPRA